MSLRPIQPGDLRSILRWRSNPDNTRYWITQDVPALDDLERQMELKRACGDITRLIDDENCKAIGYVDLFGIDSEHRHAELSIMIGEPDQQGMGYGREALELTLSLAFSSSDDDGLGLHKVSLCVVEENNAARRLYRACGFQEECRLREDFYRDGAWHDQILMSILQREFYARHRG